MSAEEVEARVIQHLAKLPWAIRENQFNLIDSHDISRLHNDPAVHPGEYRGAVIFQFMLPGAASVYYGDEAAVGGTLGTNEGCRWPMPWGTGFEQTERFRFYRTLMRLKGEHPALSAGGMQFLYAVGRILSMARFTEGETFVFVLSAEETDREIRLPLGALGCTRPAGDLDVFGTPLSWRPRDDKSITLAVPAHTALLFAAE